MDIATLYGMFLGLSEKVAALSASVRWIEWWTKVLITGTVGNMMIGGLNTVLLYRNGRNNAKKTS